MIRAIIFDCFGVLTTDKWRDFVADLPHEQQESARSLNRAYGAAIIDEQAFLAQLEELTGFVPQQVHDLLDNEDTKNTKLLGYIGELAQDYSIGLLSNVASNWIRSTLLTEAEQTYFDDMVFSYEVGMTKPDPRIYRLACQRLGVKPEDTVFIDDIPSYCEAAKQQGMQAIVYEDFASLKAQLETLLTNTNH